MNLNLNYRMFRIDKREVVLEQSSCSLQSSFYISQVPVSFQHFRMFAEINSYITTAELDKKRFTYMNNHAVSNDSLLIDMREYRPLFFVSYLDANAFCSWAKCRLPTEAEWFASSVMSEVLEANAAYDYLYFQYGTRPNAIMYEGYDITSTIDTSSSVVCRTGPRYAKTVYWKERLQIHRKLIKMNYCSSDITFRICFDTEAAIHVSPLFQYLIF